MHLTSFQKHYIKKNINNLPIEEIAIDLGVSDSEIRKYLKKHAVLKAYKVIVDNNKGSNLIKIEENVKNFKFSQFLIKNLWIFIFLFFLVFICYYNSLENAFVSDDAGIFLKGEDIKKSSYIFPSELGLLGFLGFIQRSIYFFGYKIFGANPFFFRSVNIVFHLFSTILVFSVLNLISKKRIAIFAAIALAVHPIAVESISWISGSPYSAYSFFVVLSFLFYILYGNNNKKRYLTILFFAIALIYSEKAVIFPLILLVFELSFGNLSKSWKKLIPIFSMSFILALITLFRLGTRLENLAKEFHQEDNFNNPFQIAPIAIFNYIKLIFWPNKLSLYQTELFYNKIEFFLIFLFFLLFLGVIFYTYKKDKKIFFWLSFFFISLFPTFTPVKVAWVVAERYVYLGSIGIFVVVAMFFDWLLNQREKFEPGTFFYKYLSPIVYTVFAMVIVALSVRTIYRNIDWKNEDNLWLATYKTSPSGANIHNNLGDVYTRWGDIQKAADEFKKATEISPKYAEAYHNLAQAQVKLNQLDDAIVNYKKCLQISPHIWQCHQGLTAIYFNLKEYKLASEHIKKAIELNPTDQTLQEYNSIVDSALAGNVNVLNQNPVGQMQNGTTAIIPKEVLEKMMQAGTAKN